jgi:HD superfamily phosphohydrolase YqeK|tara:strand:- start:151 stop:444 length:294 start_codon:yes stop_codon:yes gene_type:complete
MFTDTLSLPSDFQVEVHTTNNRGASPEEIAARCVKKLVYVSDKAEPAIRDQAHAFAAHIEKVIASYMKQAVQSDRTTVFNALVDAGHPELAELIRRL